MIKRGLKLIELKSTNGSDLKAKQITQRILEKRKAYKRAYNKSNPLVSKAATLRKLYGMTLEEYTAMARKQNNCCAICKGQQKQMLAVDHDHETGKIRALLCHACNLGLGKFKDNVNLLDKAITYLKEHSK